MDDILNELNYDYNFQVYIFNSCMENLRAPDKILASAWLNKLKMPVSSVQEARLRNDFLYYLNRMCTAGELQAPFKEKPPKGALLNLLNLLPSDVNKSNVPKRGTRKAELFERSPDKGAFLAAQPVPRCGAFCYLAVISRPPT